MFKPNLEKSLGQVLRRGQTDNRQFQRIETPSDTLAEGAEFPQTVSQIILFAGPGNRHPAVAVIHDALKASLAPRSKKDLRTRFLDPLWPLPERFKVDELAMKLSDVAGPDLAHCQHPFAQDFPPLPV